MPRRSQPLTRHRLTAGSDRIAQAVAAPFLVPAIRRPSLEREGLAWPGRLSVGPVTCPEIGHFPQGR